MPQFLKRDAVRLFAGSTESLSVALMTLGLPVGDEGYLLGRSYVSATGLLGVAVELALSACLVQGYGLKFLEKSPGQFKTAAEVLRDFRTLVRDGKANAAFLAAGIKNPVAHAEKLLKSSTDLKRLATVRAAALHGGVGLGRDACLIEAHRVADFLRLLAESDRIHPYLVQVRRPPDPPVDRSMLLDDLLRALRPGPQSPFVATSLLALLPGLPEEQPEWFESLSGCVTTPRELDVSLLLSAMNAMPATLRKTGTKGSGLTFRVDPTNPNAIPVRPEDLKNALSQLRDRWGASRGVAAGHLGANSRVTLPSQDDIREAFSVGLEESGILDPGKTFGPHEVWPFVASSLEVQGTPGPYWFLLRRTDDLGQTRALLEKVAKRNGWKPQRLAELVDGLTALHSNRARAVPEDLANWAAAAEASRPNLAAKTRAHRSDAKALPSELETLAIQAAGGDVPVGDAIRAVLAANIRTEAKRYWTRIMCESASEVEDVASLVLVLQEADLSVAHTAARKALRWIDYAMHGPPISTSSA